MRNIILVFVYVPLIIIFVSDRQESRQKSRHLQYIDKDGTYLYLLNLYKFVLRQICLVDRFVYSPAEKNQKMTTIRWPIDAQKVFFTHNTIVTDNNKI